VLVAKAVSSPCTSAARCRRQCGHVPATHQVLFELLWVHVCAARDVLIGALYHPPQPLYQTTELLNHIEDCVDAVELTFPGALIILAGDFNTMPEDDVIARTALSSIVDQPTRGVNKLDRIYVSEPSYTSVKVVASARKSDTSDVQC